MRTATDTPDICIISTVHPWNDPRILSKEALTLAKCGYRVRMVVCGQGPSRQGGVVFDRLQKPQSRFVRLTRTNWSAFSRARISGGRAFHIHDPELLPLAFLLKVGGARVVYDSHENLPLQILSKGWIPRFLRVPLAFLVGRFENWVVRRLDAVVAATPKIRDRFSQVAKVSIDVCNYPRLEEFASKPGSSTRPSRLCYLGALTAIRGVREMIQAVSSLPATLALAGRFESDSLRRECMSLDGWSKVEELGVLDRGGVIDVLGSSRIGLCLLHDVPNYLDSMPTKIFEYMAAGIPVVASDLPMLRRLVREAGVGLCVNVEDVESIADAFRFLLENPQEAQKMGRRGREVVAQRHNWKSEAEKLTGLYLELLGAPAPATALDAQSSEDRGA